MDDIPFAFADSVLHCLNNESYSLTGSLHDRVWTAACSTHQTRRVNFELDIFFRDNGTFLCYLQRERSNDHIQTLSNEPYLSYIRIDTVAFSMDGPLQRKNDEMSFNEVLDIVIPLKPLLPAVRELHFVIGQPNGDYDGREQRKHLRKLDFLWKLQVAQYHSDYLFDMASKNVFVVAAKRTPFGTFGGKLKNHSATDLAEISTKAALQEAGVKPEKVDHIIIGNVIQTASDAIYLPRHVGLRVGVPQNVGALAVNRLCGSGFQAVVNASHQILLGESRIVVAGGVENMSQTPYTVRNVRFGTTLGANYEFEDTLWKGLTDSHVKLPMGMTAEKLGAQYKVTREEADAFAVRSQTLWKKAKDANVFDAEIVAMKLKSRKGEVVFDTDEHPRPGTTVEQMAKLPPVFQKNGLVNAGNASGICDGSASLILAGDEAVKAEGLKPLVRIVAWDAVGVDPSIMGIGPAPAIRSVLKKANLKLEDIDLVEVNEAFAPQALAVQRELGIAEEKFNVNGGAIALGHPLGASGARISGHLAHEMKRRGVKYGIGSACIGGGQGIAILFENVN
ncbi:hypothetical protein QR680_008128 [Steinernema hermaphroditum]|uniref:Uncharacterized protein n=1 Tax=Steinernema hermaphroditum TaxID=289476 RepID=A0AA39M741_9BILA|nr:hypothetical protein QR680_008128 [Steinernema hermaphroditum]